jgi:hypothetical protein
VCLCCGVPVAQDDRICTRCSNSMLHRSRPAVTRPKKRAVAGTRGPHPRHFLVTEHGPAHPPRFRAWSTCSCCCCSTQRAHTLRTPKHEGHCRYGRRCGICVPHDDFRRNFEFRHYSGSNKVQHTFTFNWAWKHRLWTSRPLRSARAPRGFCIGALLFGAKTEG